MKSKGWYAGKEKGSFRRMDREVPALPRGLRGKDPPANAGGTRSVGSILGSGRSAGEGNGNSLQYSCLGNPTGRGATVHRVTKRQTQGSD